MMSADKQAAVVRCATPAVPPAADNGLPRFLMTPTAEQIAVARNGAKLTQPEAAALIYSTKRTWQDWELGRAAMHPGLWELFRLKLHGRTPSTWSSWSGTYPTPEQVTEARKAADLTQPAAADLIGSTKRTWQDWERNVARMHPGLWELFLVVTGLAESYLGVPTTKETSSGT